MKKNNFDIEIFKELGIDINLQEIEFTKEIKTISKNEEVDQLTSQKYLEFKNKDNKQKIGYLDGNYIRDSHSSRVGQIDGKYLRDANGNRLIEFDGRDIRDSRGSRIATIDDVKKIIDGIGGMSLVAMWVLFIR